MLKVSKLSKHFGGLVAVDQVDMNINKGDVLGLIGPNGSGKTTIINMITGIYTPTGGEVTLEGQPVTGKKPFEITEMGIARTFQILKLFKGLSALENVMIGQHLGTKTGVWQAIFRLPSYKREEKQVRERAMELLDFMDLTALADRTAGILTTGQARLLDIARCLATNPKVILLDEPASGLNSVEKEQLLEKLIKINKLGMTILIIEHDMDLVMKFCPRLVVLDHGKVIAKGTPEQIQNDPHVVEAYLGKKAVKKVVG